MTIVSLIERVYGFDFQEGIKPNSSYNLERKMQIGRLEIYVDKRSFVVTNFAYYFDHAGLQVEGNYAKFNSLLNLSLSYTNCRDYSEIVKEVKYHLDIVRKNEDTFKYYSRSIHMNLCLCMYVLGYVGHFD